MPIFSMALFESRYVLKDWERYLHRIYYGKVYYWFENLLLQSVIFEEYLLEAGLVERQAVPLKTLHLACIATAALHVRPGFATAKRLARYSMLEALERAVGGLVKEKGYAQQLNRIYSD